MCVRVCGGVYVLLGMSHSCEEGKRLLENTGGGITIGFREGGDKSKDRE